MSSYRLWWGRVLCASVFIGGFAAAAAAQEKAGFEGLGDLGGTTFSSSASAASSDGSVVVGRSSSEQGTEPFRWEDGEMTGLGALPGGVVSSRADDVSAGGSVVVGLSNSANGPQEAFRWTQDGGMAGLGDLDGGGFNSGANAVSDDGSIVVGQALSANGIEAFRWQDGEMAGLGDLDGGNFNSTAYGISADGAVIVGRASSAQGTEAFRWENGEMAGLGVLPGDLHSSQAEAVSADGFVVVGVSTSDQGSQAFRWEGDEMEGLGVLPGGNFFSAARDASGDGAVVVGDSTTDNGAEAFIWTAKAGMRSLKTVLEQDHDLDLTGWTLRGATGVSDDGAVIVGYGTNPDGNQEAWRAYLGQSFTGGAFVTTWKTDNSGASEDNQITLPVEGTGYDFTVDWGDGNQTAWQDGDDPAGLTHTYDAPGTYTVEISGDFPRIFFNFGGDRQKILSIEQWGDIAWSSMELAFYGASNLVVNASDVPDLSNVTSMFAMFASTWSFDGDLGDWDVSNVTNMRNLFTSAFSFNHDLGDWDVANVTDMREMFAGAGAFNQDIGGWDVSSVVDMAEMFFEAESFNQDLSAWDVSNVSGMVEMFSGASAFDRNLGAWDISSASFTNGMLDNAGLSIENYDGTLIGWAGQDVQADVEMGAEGLEYCTGADARQALIDDHGWNFTGDVVHCDDPAAPVIDVDPDSLSSTLQPDQMETRSLTIANLGDETLDWAVTEAINALERIDALGFEAGENAPNSAVMDPAGEYAYFGTETSEGPERVVKVDLDKLERVGAVELEAGEERLWTAVIDPQGDYAYFGTGAFGVPGKVVKVDLGTFERVGSITFEDGENVLKTSAIDPSGAFALFGTFSNPGHVVMVDLDSFERTAGITFEPGEWQLESAVIDPEGRFAYFGAFTVPGRVVKVHLPGPLECALPGWVSVDPAGGSVSGGGDSLVDVTFDAAGLEPGEYTASLCLASNDPANGLVVIPVALTVEEVAVPGELSLEPAVLDFGEMAVGNSSVMSITVANTAEPDAESLELAAIEGGGSPAFQITGGDCKAGLELAPEQSCEVEVRFMPDAEIKYLDTVTVTTIDSQDGTVELAGTGVEPPGDDIFADRFEE